MKRLIDLCLTLILLSACAAPPTQPPTVVPPTGTSQVKLPNPASVFCEQQGYRMEIRTAADGSQAGVCIFPDGSECDEWAYYRGECQAPAPQPPTALPVDPSAYQGWWTYTHAVYGFSIMLPEDWIVVDTAANDPLLNGHWLQLHPKYSDENESIRMTFRRKGEDTLLWPTGVGQGEWLPQGTLEVDGQPAQRVLLVCPGGDVTAIWYHQADGKPNLERGGMEFGFIFSAGGHCQADLNSKTRRLGEQIIASLRMP